MEKETAAMKRSVVAVALVASLVGIPAAAMAQSTKPASKGSVEDRRGDVGIGYTFMHETGLSLPAGFVLSDAFRFRPNFDVVLETGYNHGSVLGVGMSVLGVSGGVRGSYGTRYGSGTTAFGQVLMGMVRGSASMLGQSASVNGFNIQPGFGVEVPLNSKWGVRPQFDVMIEHINGVWGNDMRFGVSAVYKINNSSARK